MTACVECKCFKARPGAKTCKMCNDPITVQRRRINAEIQVIKQGLTDWTVVRGEHAELARVVGRK